jgi:hypothetical protein
MIRTLDRIAQATVAALYVVGVGALVAIDAYVSASIFAVFGGYALFRAWWAGRLSAAFVDLADRFDYSGPPEKEDDFFEEWARLTAQGYVLRCRAHWVARWPLRGVRFRLPVITDCPCGGARVFIEAGERDPARFRYVCAECGQGARHAIDLDIAAATARLVKRGPGVWGSQA